MGVVTADGRVGKVTGWGWEAVLTEVGDSRVMFRPRLRGANLGSMEWEDASSLKISLRAQNPTGLGMLADRGAGLAVLSTSAPERWSSLLLLHLHTCVDPSRSCS